MARILSVSDENIREAANQLIGGEIVAFPTETVYGLGGNALHDGAIAKIYATKQRPSRNPLIVHVAHLSHFNALVQPDERSESLIDAFWPGPLTLILPVKLRSTLSPLVTAGLSTVAVRMPSHPVAKALLQATDLPIAAPSANLSGKVSPTSAEHVTDDLGCLIDVILDAGESPIGLESTVLDLSNPHHYQILRHGVVTGSQIEAILGPSTKPVSSDGWQCGSLKSPGQLASHYAPTLPVRLDAETCKSDEAYLAFGPTVPENAAVSSNLSERGDLDEAAHNLYHMLRDLDRSKASRIAVAPIPKTGIGAAINDRLRRSAAPRSYQSRLAS